MANTDYEYPDTELQFNSQLIMCIEELDCVNGINSIDTRLFIGWNRNKNEFFVRGKRQDKKIINKKYVPYGLCFKNKEELLHFISFAMDKEQLKNITLYNFNNILDKSDFDLSYEFFENNMNVYYEVCGYDSIKWKKSKFSTYLEILQKSHN
jgi:hypothetical protein